MKKILTVIITSLLVLTTTIVNVTADSEPQKIVVEETEKEKDIIFENDTGTVDIQVEIKYAAEGESAGIHIGAHRALIKKSDSGVSITNDLGNNHNDKANMSGREDGYYFTDSRIWSLQNQSKYLSLTIDTDTGSKGYNAVDVNIAKVTGKIGDHTYTFNPDGIVRVHVYTAPTLVTKRLRYNTTEISLVEEGKCDSSLKFQYYVTEDSTDVPTATTVWSDSAKETYAGTYYVYWRLVKVDGGEVLVEDTLLGSKTIEELIDLAIKDGASAEVEIEYAEEGEDEAPHVGAHRALIDKTDKTVYITNPLANDEVGGPFTANMGSNVDAYSFTASRIKRMQNDGEKLTLAADLSKDSSNTTGYDVVDVNIAQVSEQNDKAYTFNPDGIVRVHVYTAPTLVTKRLRYNTTEISLVEEGKCDSSLKFEYYVSTSYVDQSTITTWSDSAKATNAGTYYVYWRLVKVDDGEVLAQDKFDPKNILKADNADVNAKDKETLEYNFVKNIDKKLVLKATAPSNDLLSVEIDGKDITGKNGYSIEEGSTIFTLKQSILYGLSNGKHIATLNYNNYESVSFIINISTYYVPDYKVPTTGIN